MRLLLALLLVSSICAAAELDSYYIAPFIDGTAQPANGGYVPCDGYARSGYWTNTEGHDVYAINYGTRLSANLTAYWAELVMFRENANGTYTAITSSQADSQAKEQQVSLSPDSLRIPNGGRVVIYVKCTPLMGAAMIPVYGQTVPTVQAIAYAFFRDNP